MSPTGTAGAIETASAGYRWRPWVVLLIFAALSLTTVLRHEMWRDEVHAWQAAVSAGSLPELVDNVRAEGHPGLWFAILYPLSRATGSPVAMQLVHWLIAVGVAALVLFVSPFRWTWRVMIVVGYFPLYEYCAISRNYAVGALLLFAFCAVYPIRRTRPLVAASLLFLLAQANVYSLILSFALGLMWIVDDRMQKDRTALWAGALAVWLGGMALSVVQLLGALAIKKPFDPEKTLETGRTLDVLATPWRALVPIPALRFRFWNSNILDGLNDGGVLQAVLGLVLIALVATIFVRRPPVFVLYLAGSGGLMAFTFFFYIGGLRHQGHHTLLLLAALWLWAAGSGTVSGRTTAKIPLFRGVLVGALLLANAMAGIYATARDWRDPFSASRATAAAIRADGLDDLPIVGHRDVQVATVAAYLGRPIFFPSLGREASFISSTASGWTSVDDTEVLRQARVLSNEVGSDVLVVFSRFRRPRPDVLDSAVRIGGFSDSIVRTERYELYRVPMITSTVD